MRDLRYEIKDFKFFNLYLCLYLCLCLYLYLNLFPNIDVIYKTLSVYFLLKSEEISFSFISECIAVALRFCFTIDGLCNFSVEIDVLWRYSISFSVNDEDVFSRFCISFYFVTIAHNFSEIHGSS